MVIVLLTQSAAMVAPVHSGRHGRSAIAQHHSVARSSLVCSTSIGINGWSVSSSDIPDSSALSLAAVNDARDALTVASSHLRRSFGVGASAVVVSPAHQHANHVCSVVADHAELRCIHAWSCLLALICFSTSFALLILMFSGEGGSCNVILSFLICFTCSTSFYYCVCLAAPLRCNHAWPGLLAFSQGGGFTTSSGPGSLSSLNVRLFGERGSCTADSGLLVCLNNSFDFDFLVRLVDDSLASSRGGRGCTCGNGTSTPPPVQQCCTSGLPHQQATLGTALPFLAPGDGQILGEVTSLLAPGYGQAQEVGQITSASQCAAFPSYPMLTQCWVDTGPMERAWGQIAAAPDVGFANAHFLVPPGQMVLPISPGHLLAPGDGHGTDGALLAPGDGQMVLPISPGHLLAPVDGHGNSLLG